MKIMHGKQSCQRVKGALNKFLAHHPLRKEDFVKLDLLGEKHPEMSMAIKAMLMPGFNPDRTEFGKHELAEAARFVAYTKLANTISNAGGTGNFETEFSFSGNPLSPVRFEKCGARVAIADIRIMPDDELVRMDIPQFRLTLPAKQKYSRVPADEKYHLFVSGENCRISHLNMLLRHYDADEIFQSAAQYAEALRAGECAKNPVDGGKELYVSSIGDYIIRLGGSNPIIPSAYVLKRQAYSMNQFADQFSKLLIAVHRMVTDSTKGL